MEPNRTNTLLAIAFFSFIFFNAAQAVCVPRNFTYLSPSSSPESPKLQPVSSPESQPPNAASPTATTNPPSGSGESTPTSTLNPPSIASNLLRPFKDLLKENPLNSVKDTNSVPPASTTNLDIKKICGTTDYSGLCLSSITPLLTGKTDMISVLEMAIKACTQHAKLAIAAAEGFATTHKGDSIMVSRFSDCLDNFDDALDSLQSALDAIPSRDTGTINTMLSAVITDASTCADAFEGKPSPLDSFDDMLRQLASNCLAIAASVK